MITIGISEFRANMNKILSKIQDGEIVSLTLRGTEIAKYEFKKRKNSEYNLVNERLLFNFFRFVFEN